MGDQPDNQPAKVAPGEAQPQPTATTQPSYITSDQFAEALDKLNKLDQKIDQAYRGMQSKTDSFQSKVQKQIESWEAKAKEAGYQLTDADKHMLQQNAVFQTLNEEASTDKSFVYQPGQAIPQGISEDQLIEGVDRAAEAMYKAANIEITRGDAEDAILAAAESGTPDEYLNAVKQAIEAKQKRIGQTSTTAQPTTTPATNISPGLARGAPQSNPIANINNRDELWKLAKEKLG
jgi:hypothetical protein